MNIDISIRSQPELENLMREILLDGIRDLECHPEIVISTSEIVPTIIRARANKRQTINLTTPHSSWAEVYDFVYEQLFADLFQQMTAATIEQIKSCTSAPARIVDFGTGTGRISIPLASLGYEVVGVEPCQEMLDQLSRKPGSEYVTTVKARMQDFTSVDQFDMAICVFTVVSYLLNEETLEKSIENAARVLRPDGHLLIDIPSRMAFQSYRRRTPEVDRSVKIIPQGRDQYLYEEGITVLSSGVAAATYEDKFSLRYWEIEKIKSVLAKYGFCEERDVSDAFLGTGSRYLLMKKT